MLSPVSRCVYACVCVLGLGSLAVACHLYVCVSLVQDSCCSSLRCCAFSFEVPVSYAAFRWRWYPREPRALLLW